MRTDGPEALIQDWAHRIARGMTTVGRDSASEEDVRHGCNSLIDRFIEAAELNVSGRHEYRIAAGRLDSKYQRVLLEYKDPHGAERLSPGLAGVGNRAVKQQLRARFDGLEHSEGASPERLFGVGCDGLHLLFVRSVGGKLTDEPAVAVTPFSVERLLRALISLGAHGKSFLPETLAADFGAQSDTAKRGIRKLYDVLLASTSPKARTLFDEWKLLFGEVCGYGVERVSILGASLSRQFGIDDATPDALLFAIHTYYAVLMKLLAAEITSSLQPLGLTAIKQCVAAPTDAALQRELARLEEGGIWAQLGIRNFLEGDIFAWYLAAWSAEVAESLRGMISRLDEYDPASLSGAPEGHVDLLKRLYQELLPRRVRHALGEYYTPDWLAEYILDRLEYDGNPDTRVLDPACGSGTFLVAVLNRAKGWFAEHRHECGFDERGLLERLLENVIGFDLNPLAAMASRTNYLLAIRDLLRHAAGPVELPVYLCDSIQIPSEYGDLLTTGVLGAARQIRTSAAEFVIPIEVGASRDLIGQYANALELCVTNRYSEDEFVDHLRSVAIPVAEQSLHRQLFSRLVQLEGEGKNGIWARIIRNQFAPLFTRPVDLIVGNPPWVNWEHLPERYREETLPLWERYELRGTAGRGGRQRSRQSKTDVAYLMTYVAVDAYLVDHGRLGFVMTQSAFQSELGGRQFRRFRIPGGAGLRVAAVTDLVRVSPFEDAANRTSVLELEKGPPTVYPVPYPTWARRRNARLPEGIPLRSVRECTVRRDWVAVPVRANDTRSAWMVGREDGLRVLRGVIGRSDYSAQVREGANTRGANGVFYVDEVQRRADSLIVVKNKPEMGRRRTDGTHVDEETGVVEPGFLFPLLTGRDVHRWVAEPRMRIVVPHTNAAPSDPLPEGELRRSGPNTHAFLKKFEPYLRTRRPFRNFDPSSGPFYGLYNVGHYTFQPYKVVWREIASDFIAAPVGPDRSGVPVVANHKLMVVPVATWHEALYVAGVLSSSLFRYGVLSYAVSTQISTHVLEHLQLPRFRPSIPAHAAIAQLSGDAAAAARAGDAERLLAVERSIDRWVAEMLGVQPADLDVVTLGLNELADFLAESVDVEASVDEEQAE